MKGLNQLDALDTSGLHDADASIYHNKPISTNLWKNLRLNCNLPYDDQHGDVTHTLLWGISIYVLFSPHHNVSTSVHMYSHHSPELSRHSHWKENIKLQRVTIMNFFYGSHIILWLKNWYKQGNNCLSCKVMIRGNEWELITNFSSFSIPNQNILMLTKHRKFCKDLAKELIWLILQFQTMP